MCKYEDLQIWQECAVTNSVTSHLCWTTTDGCAELHENQSRPGSCKRTSGSTLRSEILKKYVYFTLIIPFRISTQPFILIDQKTEWKWHARTFPRPQCSSPGHEGGIYITPIAAGATDLRCPQQDRQSASCYTLLWRTLAWWNVLKLNLLWAGRMKGRVDPHSTKVSTSKGDLGAKTNKPSLYDTGNQANLLFR